MNAQAFPRQRFSERGATLLEFDCLQRLRSNSQRRCYWTVKFTVVVCVVEPLVAVTVTVYEPAGVPWLFCWFVGTPFNRSVNDNRHASCP